MSNINNIEIERKFLVLDDSYKSLAERSVRIRQGYLCLNPNCSVRVRQWDEQAFLTIKSKAVKGSFSRYEFEKEIALDEFNELFKLCLSGTIDKIRWIVPISSTHDTLHATLFEVDEFLGDNAGLVMAEIELQNELQPFPHPSFLGEEVTFDPRYFNSYLSLHPYSTW